MKGRTTEKQSTIVEYGEIINAQHYALIIGCRVTTISNLEEASVLFIYSIRYVVILLIIKTLNNSQIREKKSTK